MLSKILSTATLVVVAWLSVQILQTQRAVAAAQLSFDHAIQTVRSEFSDASEQSENASADVLQRMDELSVAQTKLAKSSGNANPELIKAKNRTITHLNQKASLQDVVVNVLKADLLSVEKQGEQAAELLLSTKSGIWKLSEKWEDNTKALRDLMAPIDILAGKWKRGDYSSNSKSIQQVLQDVMSSQTKSKK